jgi:cation-transporting P-type ATPase E
LNIVSPTTPPASSTAIGDRPPEAREHHGQGLTEAEAQQRLAAAGERRRPATSRGYASIVRAIAMVGDGVNDVPALKASRLAIAQGSGAQMARSVADLVLVGGSFAVVPPMVEQGRQALRNLQRVAKLYVWRSASLGRDVARFAVPAGTLVGVGVLASYLFAVHPLALPLIEARTVGVSVVVLLGLYLILVLEATGLRRRTIVSLAVAGLGAVYVLALLIPPVRDFFELARPTLAIVLTAACGSALSIVGLTLSGFMPGAAASR